MNYPEAASKPVIDEYHCIPVEDLYRWLEDSEDLNVKEWTQAQNRLMREILDAVPRLSQP